jgi:type III restriction enzyme
MQLKRYQKEALDALQVFLEETRDSRDAAASFRSVTSLLSLGRYKSDYRPLAELPSVPYVCIRIPTGGGKTILGAQSVKMAANNYLERDYPIALWLVPSNTIRTQTVDALKNPTHPYRKVLDDEFEGRVRVFDITEFEQIRPADIRDAACIVVSTIQTLRVSNTEGRKVYAHNENLEPHFAPYSTFPAGIERDEHGKPKFSFANLLHLHNPLLIVDEAHNAVTGLTHEMQERINPACIIEYTATPKPRSNVLFSVSATALNDEEMIKLPIVLTAHTGWQAAVNGSLVERKRLSDSAKDDNTYIRPIVLFQAQNKDQDVTAEVLKQHLIETENIDSAKIAVVTGEQRELDGLNLFDQGCPIEYVITVKALKEGWDCSFVYVFCSVANIHSAADVEQLLGRVLRMPFAKKRPVSDLNRSYAHVCEPNFIKAAVELKDRLVDMGFEAEEAEDQIQVQQLDLTGGAGLPTVTPKVEVTVDSPISIDTLSNEIKEKVVISTDDEGKTVLTVDEPVTEEEEEAIVQILPEQNRELVRKELQYQRHQQQRLESPASQGKTFTVPQLCIYVQGELEFAEPDLVLHLGGWDLLKYPATLTPQEFKPSEAYQSFQVDVDKNEHVQYGHISDEIRQAELQGLAAEWDEKVLAGWLDRQCRQQDIRQETLMEFARRIITDQLDRKVTLASLVRAKYRLAKSIKNKIKEYRTQARQDNYQSYLFEDTDNVVTTDEGEFAFVFDPNIYPANSFYRGSYTFAKHYYGGHRVGELKSKGEEFECAQVIDMLDDVEYWVRNLDGRPHTSLKISKSTGFFYPDFVAKLKDGRIFVIEYKGAHLVSDPDTQHKDLVGQLWQARSNGKGLFLMVEKEKDGMNMRDQIKKKIG